MRTVSVIGTGLIKFGRYPQVSLADLGWPAVKQAMADAGVGPKDIGAVLCGTGLGGPMPGQRILGRLGMTGLPIINVENACSSGSSAINLGSMAIAVASTISSWSLGWRSSPALTAAPSHLNEKTGRFEMVWSCPPCTACGRGAT